MTNPGVFSRGIAGSLYLTDLIDLPFLFRVHGVLIQVVVMGVGEKVEHFIPMAPGLERGRRWTCRGRRARTGTCGGLRKPGNSCFRGFVLPSPASKAKAGYVRRSAASRLTFGVGVSN